MPAEPDVQDSMSSTKNKYFRGPGRGYVPTEEYKRMSKDQQQAVYHLCDERDGSSRTDSGAGNSKDYDNLKRQVSALSKKLDDSLTTE